MKRKMMTKMRLPIINSLTKKAVEAEILDAQAIAMNKFGRNLCGKWRRSYRTGIFSTNARY